jgi:hypothetical protein
MPTPKPGCSSTIWATAVGSWLVEAHNGRAITQGRTAAGPAAVSRQTGGLKTALLTW